MSIPISQFIPPPSPPPLLSPKTDYVFLKGILLKENTITHHYYNKVWGSIISSTQFLITLSGSIPHNKGYLTKSSYGLKMMKFKVSEKRYSVAMLNIGRKWGQS